MSMRPSLHNRLQFVFFAALVPSTALAFSLFPNSTHHQLFLGFLLLLWSGFFLLRLLWMLELDHAARLIRMRKEQADASPLPSRLLDSVQSRNVLEERVQSWQALSYSTYMSALLLALYAGWGVYISLTASPAPALMRVENDIVRFLSVNVGAFSIRDLQHFTALAAQLCLLAIFALAFWMTLSFCHVRAYRKPVQYILGTVFALCLFLCAYQGFALSDLFFFQTLAGDALWQGYGWNDLPLLRDVEVLPPDRLSLFQIRLLSVGVPGVAIFYALGFFLAMLMVRGLLLSKDTARYALAGLLLLAVLFTLDFFVVYFPALGGVLLSGWLLLATLSVRSTTGVERRYIIRPQ